MADILCERLLKYYQYLELLRYSQQFFILCFCFILYSMKHINLQWICSDGIKESIIKGITAIIQFENERMNDRECLYRI